MATVKMREQQTEWTIKAIAGIVTLLFCYITMVHPAFLDIAVLRRSIADAQVRVELFQDIRELSKNLRGLEKDLANLTERSLLLGQLSDIAGKTNLDLDTLTPRTEPDGEYTRLKIETEGKGTFFSLLKFLEAVEKVNAAIRVRDVSLANKLFEDGAKKKRLLQIHLVFETLLKHQSRKNNV